jgi:hypothetical protein
MDVLMNGIGVNLWKIGSVRLVSPLLSLVLSEDFIALNGVDWDAYDFAKEIAEYDELGPLTQVTMYRGMLNATILTAFSGGAVGTVRERNELTSSSRATRELYLSWDVAIPGA